MNTIITSGNNDYRMSIIYDKSTCTFILVFSSIKNNHGEQHTCKSYMDAVQRFLNNCRWYGAPVPLHIPIEQEFLGIPDGVWPQSKQQSLGKEVSRCRA